MGIFAFICVLFSSFTQNRILSVCMFFIDLKFITNFIILDTIPEVFHEQMAKNEFTRHLSCKKMVLLKHEDRSFSGRITSLRRKKIKPKKDLRATWLHVYVTPFLMTL